MSDMSVPDTPDVLTEQEREDLGQRLMLAMTCNHGEDYFGTGAVCETCWANTQRVGRIIERIVAAERERVDAAVQDVAGWRNQAKEYEGQIEALAQILAANLLREAADDIRDRRREFQRLGAEEQYLLALDDAFGLVSNRVRAALGGEATP